MCVLVQFVETIINRLFPQKQPKAIEILSLIAKASHLSCSLILKCQQLLSHYANMSVQYVAIFHGSKNGKFQMKKCDIFRIFA